MSPAQITANRANAQLSTGPKTEAGKAASSANATKHGLSGRKVVIAGESEEEYNRFIQTCRVLYKPVGDMESDLVQEIAASRWRLRRVEALEASLLDDEMDLLLNDPENPVDESRVMAVAFRNLADSRTGALAQLHRHEGRLRRAYEKALRELRELQAERREQEQQNEASLSELTQGTRPSQSQDRKPSAFLEACLQYVDAPLPQKARQGAA